ncbi:MAG: precorrin-2 dehydrogenase/sirohydrochlorin ferrochelatase family protein [Candidatus Rifleibacteriota bacterium]
MKPLPLFFNLEGKQILIIGGGRIALRKARKFKQAGAQITVIAPRIIQDLITIAEKTYQRPANEQDIKTEFQMILIATDNKALNDSLAHRCKSKNILYSRCDDFSQSDFFTCTDLDFDSITISIFSGGVPETSKFLRHKIEKLVGEELVQLNNILSSLRPDIKARFPLEEERKDFYADCLSQKTLQRIKEIGPEKLKKELESCL